MIRPRKMKRIELTVLAKDVDRVIEFLGHHGLIHFSKEEPPVPDLTASVPSESIHPHIGQNIENIRSAAAYLEIDLPTEPEETSRFPGEPEKAVIEKLCTEIASLNARAAEEDREKQKLEYALGESRVFANLNAPFKDWDQLSYLTLRVGRLDPRGHEEMQKNLGDRGVVIIPLGENRILSAASRKAQFALDAELKKHSFVPITIPEGFHGIPAEIIAGLESRLQEVAQEQERIAARKTQLRDEYASTLRSLAASYLMASLVEELKGNLVATRNVFFLSGWVLADRVSELASRLSTLTEGRIGIRTFVPEEVNRVKEGTEKVPVSLKHGPVVGAFEGLVFSYGAPLYGTIDPTPFVAFFFMIFFGVMFGDLGQGFVLLLLGILSSKRGIKAMARFRSYSLPLIAVSSTSMIMGLLTGSIFSNEELLVKPTQKVLGFFMSLFGQTGEPPDRILHLMPDMDNIEKLFYFFGFAIGLGVIFNSVGLWVNVINQWSLKNYEKALFSKTGMSGIIIFWYALSIGIRCLLGGGFALFDLGILIIPTLCIFFGPVIWGLISGKRPLLHEGLLVFIIEGSVEIIEILSTYISSTVSFLRVGAFALSHTVLSFIVFTLSERVSHIIGGSLFSFIILVLGNLVIILLEGMIVAIQVVRLQYYEFFSKFFTETGVEFVPFRFRKQAVSDEAGGTKAPIVSENSNSQCFKGVNV